MSRITPIVFPERSQKRESVNHFSVKQKQELYLAGVAIQQLMASCPTEEGTNFWWSVGKRLQMISQGETLL